MKSVKIFFSLIFFLFCCSSLSYSFSISEVFPKASELQGGASHWILSDIKEEKRDRCSVYTNTYTYYSEKNSVFYGITRNNTYMVSVRIFACDNFITASEEYKNLLKAEENIKKPKHSAPAAFGERSVLTAVPFRENTLMADFYLTFIMRNFVVQVYSDDGFAQTDMAGEVERRLKNYFYSLGPSFFINKINLKISHKNLKDYFTDVSFTGEDISSVLIEGTVYDDKNRPVSDASITVKETGQTVKTDEKGNYTVDIKAGEGRSLSLKKIIFIKDALPSDISAFPSGLYSINIKNGNNENQRLILNILSSEGKIIGSAFNTDGSGNYRITGNCEGKNISFNLNCTALGSSFRCMRLFNGISENGYVAGTWKGTGGKGTWNTAISGFDIASEEPYLRDIGITLTTVSLSDEGILSEGKDILTADNDKKNRHLIHINTEKNNIKSIYFKDAFINFKTDKNNCGDSCDIVLYEADKSGEKYRLKKLSLISSLKKGEKKDIDVNINSLIRYPDKSGYFIGIESKSKSSIDFSLKDKAHIVYYKDSEGYKSVETLSSRFISDIGEDITGNYNNIKPDGEADIVIEASLSAKGRTLEHLEIICGATPVRRWNTNTFDIYPSIAVKYKNDIINKQDGSLSHKLTEDKEIYRLYIYKGTLDNISDLKFTIRAVIDGKVYENIVSN